MNFLLPKEKPNLILLTGFVLVVQVFFAVGLKSQENQPLDSVLAQVRAISMAEISVQATSLGSSLAEERKILLSEDEKTRYDEQVDSVLARYDAIMEDPRQKRFEEINSRELETLKNEWRNVYVRMEQTQKEMTSRVEGFENKKASLQVTLWQWNLTLDQAENENATQAVLEQIKYTINAIEGVITELNENSGFLQEDLVKVSEKLISSNEIVRTLEVLLDESFVCEGYDHC